jgi:glycosyltransferase involved in cell wall biosynthesis
MSTKVALVYDRVNKWGGAERVLLALHEIFPDAVLFTSVYDQKKADWAKIFPKVIPSFLQKIPYLQDKHEFLGTFMPGAFESFDLTGFDLVISVTSEAAKGVIAKPGTKHLCYCLTPTRYLWNAYNIYFPKGDFLRYLAFPAVWYLRKWERIAARRPDKIIAISSAIKKRIKKYYGRDSQIIFPPVEIDKFTNSKLNEKLKMKNGKYFLIVSRLVPYKKVDLAVKAFNKLGYPLLIIGKGTEEKKLKSIARKNIKFVREVSEKKLVEYYQRAKALIMPQEEDFGIVAIEAQAAGTPVIAYKAGGALDTIIEGKTGIFFEKQTVKNLIEVIRKFNKFKFTQEDLIKNAAKFSKKRFKQEFLDLINTEFGDIIKTL